MRVGIISDTHNSERNVKRAVDIFKEQGVDWILHAGDIVSPGTVELFAGVDGARFIGVFGNCDIERETLAEVVRGFGGEIHDDSYSGTVGEKRIFMKHKLKFVADVAGGGEYDMVVYGHTHKLDVRRVGAALVVNPGTAKHWLAGKSKVVVVGLDDMSIEVIPLA